MILIPSSSNLVALMLYEDDKIVATIKALLSIDPTFARMANKENLTPLEIAKKSGHNLDDASWNKIIGEITLPYFSQGEITDLEHNIESNLMEGGSSKNRLIAGLVTGIRGM